MRQLEKDMIAFLDKKLKGNGMADDAIAKRNARQLFIEVAKACVGIREEGGNNRGPMVELIQDTIGNHGRESWCMSFIQTCLGYAEIKTGIMSPIFPSEHCLTVWAETPKVQRVKIMPLAGAITIWQHGTSSSGHTGCVLDCDTKIFHSIEGNTESGLADGKVIRDGGGVYFTERSRKGNGDMRVVGFLKPF